MTALDDQVQAILAGTGGYALDPRDLSTMFQDAAGTIPVTTPGQTVGRIVGKWGIGATAVWSETILTAHPLWDGSDLIYDGATDLLNGNAETDLPRNAPAMFFCGLVNLQDFEATRGILGLSVQSATQSRFVVTIDPTGQVNIPTRRPDATGYNVVFPTLIFPVGVATVLSCLADVAGASMAYAWVNGVAGTPFPLGAAAPYSDTASGRRRLGANVANSPNRFFGKFGRQVHCPFVPTESQRLIFEAWVNEGTAPPPVVRTLNFPASPVLGQVFEAEGASFVWNGSLWVVLSAASFPWATAAEAIAGARADVAVSPLTAKIAMDARGYTFKGNIQQQPVDLAGTSRVGRTIYQNDTGRSLLVALVMRPVSGGGTFFLRLGASSADMSLAVGGETGGDTNRRRSALAVVPPGWFYQADLASGNIEIENWHEYRG